MKKTLLVSLMAASISVAPSVYANDLPTELSALKQRIAQLESQLSNTMAEQASVKKSVAQASVSPITISGSAEFLATDSKLADDSRESDLDVDSVELTVEAAVNEYMALSTTLKYEDDGEDQDFFVDEAIVSISAEGNPWSLIAGRTAVPFAVINGNAWSDPLTDDLTDNTDDLLFIGFDQGIFSAGSYLFKGQSDESNVDNLGLNAALAFDNGFVMGVGYLNNIRNTDPFQADSLTDDEKVSAARINLSYELNALALSAEYLKTDSFEELAGRPQVTAWHLSADYATNVFGAPGNLSLGYSKTDDAELLTDGGDNLFAESRVSLGASRELHENAELIVELVREEDYAGDETDTLNLVLSTSF
ncbi:LbtU family siderophore porin [Amphritea sp. 1_MG-2023]|uniref:LbtU family siderophore porin n=1 Tax=Amphritea sp. 1_MG-2023 TaxID=3062670 RepID=UPI0026E4776F|nr:LbtU family siderophore porin [Amphritea sp. 1_MG-2023]MDO6562330.1 LbtU family siderophore porin [Amphritea sp. 1_MG-2023]